MRILKPVAVAAAAASFALAGCEQQQQQPGNDVATDPGADEMVVAEPETGPTDPATGNLTLESPPAQVDTAINQTDAQANLGNEVGNLQ